MVEKSSDILSTSRKAENSIVPAPIPKLPNKVALPPMRTLSIAAQLELSTGLPESVKKLLKAMRISRKLREFGVPAKLVLMQEDISDLIFITTYMVSQKPTLSKHYMELLVHYRQQAFWLMAIMFRPNTPYCTFLCSEEDSSAASVLAGHIVSYYLTLSTSPTDDGSIVRWYRSLEFVPTKQNTEKAGCVVIQCKWPSWVDDHDKLLRCLRNIRASYDDANVIFLISEDDLAVVPQMLSNEPFGCFMKVALKTAITPGPQNKVRKPAISKVLTKLKRLDVK